MTENRLSEYRLEQVEDKVKKLVDDVDELQDFKTSTIEKLTTVLEKIKDLNTSNQWLKRSLFTMIGGGVITIIGTIIVRALTN